MSEEQQEPVTGETQTGESSPRDEVKQVREAIARLEQIANQIEEASDLSLPPSAFRVLAASVEGLSTAVETPESYREMVVRERSELEAEPVAVTAVISPEGLPKEPVPDTDEDLLSLQTLQNAWEWVLEKVRDLLPESVEENLSDGALTGILGGLIALILVGTIAFSGGDKPESVAGVPERVEPAIEQPQQPQQPTNTLPPEITAPTPPKPVITPKPKPFSLPFSRPKLTPEQSLIAAIQEQVLEITNEYADGLISSIQANFFSGNLTVTVGTEWYDLPQSQQNELANEVLKRAKQLDFTKIEILDEQGAMVARSPVVGNEMVVFKRMNDAS
ncbi:hypothetical protein [Spirulina sp. 06S082]|uniref:hypothetical protein n=1 Tax=Spirulina sp. 06S082 TaxID=3110248 RepID=UPI002B20D85A|nr:hypothetical protein [Spirulina sp. 06S082]MEA5470057.1 hypothetical protein [Spirulina sp. 06S082]